MMLPRGRDGLRRLNDLCGIYPSNGLNRVFRVRHTFQEGVLICRTAKGRERDGSSSLFDHSHHFLPTSATVNIARTLTTPHHSFPCLHHFPNLLHRSPKTK